MSLARLSHNNQTRSPQLTATLPPPSPPTTARPQPPRFGAALRDCDPQGPARPLQIHTETRGQAAGGGRAGGSLTSRGPTSSTFAFNMAAAAALPLAPPP